MKRETMKRDIKILYFDVETTGLSVWHHDIIQFAALVEINGALEEEVNFKMQPLDLDNIDPKAVEVHGMDRDFLSQQQTAREGYGKILSLLDRFIDRYNKLDKFYAAGFNVGFDVKFLSKMFYKHNNKFFGSYFFGAKLDPYQLIAFVDVKKGEPQHRYTLATLASRFGISLQAHDALSDIKATRELTQILMKRHVQV